MFPEKRGLSAAVPALFVVLIIIAVALSFTVGQNATRSVTVTQTMADIFTVTTTQVSLSTVTVTTTPPDYFQVNGVTLYSGTASAKTTEGTASIQFTVTGPLTTTSTTTACYHHYQYFKLNFSLLSCNLPVYQLNFLHPDERRGGQEIPESPVSTRHPPPSTSA